MYLPEYIPHEVRLSVPRCSPQSVSSYVYHISFSRVLTNSIQVDRPPLPPTPRLPSLPFPDVFKTFLYFGESEDWSGGERGGVGVGGSGAGETQPFQQLQNVSSLILCAKLFTSHKKTHTQQQQKTTSSPVMSTV